MPWVRIDEEFPHHPKVASVGPLGVAVQVAALCYSNRYLTDGFIPYGAVRTLLDFNRIGENIGDKVEVWVELGGMVIAQRLVQAGMWEEVDGGFLIHDYHLYQPSRAQVEAERKKTKERVAKYRETKRKGGNSPRSSTSNKGRNESGNAVTNGSETAAPVPVPDIKASTTHPEDNGPPSAVHKGSVENLSTSSQRRAKLRDPQPLSDALTPITGQKPTHPTRDQLKWREEADKRAAADRALREGSA